MDAFTWIIILVLGVCILMHFRGHGHGPGAHADQRAGPGARIEGEENAEETGDHASQAGDSEDRHGCCGCH